LRNDPFHPKLASTPWASSLLPNEKLHWIDKGVVSNLFYDRFWAGKAIRKPTPAPSNLVLDGQENSVADLIKSVERGLLITRLWYIRVVQPQTWQLTGLSRDGVFLVKNGNVTDPVTNFRWNESPAEVLQRTIKLSRPEMKRVHKWRRRWLQWTSISRACRTRCSASYSGTRNLSSALNKATPMNAFTAPKITSACRSKTTG
jgi:predicted Zn-dependent protease